MPRNFHAVNKEVNPMKEIMQSLFSHRLASHRKSNTLRVLPMLVLLVAVAMVFVLLSPLPTTSATAKDAHRSRAVPAQEECDEVSQEGEDECSTEGNGTQTCRRNFREPFSEVVTNPCTGESVLITGEIHIVTHTTINRNSMHTRFHTQIHGTGTTVEDSSASARAVKYLFASTRAPQETDYTFSTNINGGQNSGPPPENFSDPMSVHVISRGGSPNFRMHFVLLINSTPSGQTTCVVHTSSDCSGQEEVIGL
jgi:uncharacterized membrane protein